MINEKFLLDKGATFRKYKKNQTIFFEGNMAAFYYQVLEGSIRMVSINESGKEFIQGIFKSGQSFGEPVLLIDEPYPASAVANEDTLVLIINKADFLIILKEHPEILFNFSQTLAKRIYNKSLVAKELSIQDPEHRVFSILKLLKNDDSNKNPVKYKVQLSRQQIADMTGLRVETVIRTIKNLEKKDVIKIQKGKIYL
jgi:CRP/FNR family transcriptional regulator, cyclic AMP receptor protein